MVIGYVWFGPLFGKMWQKQLGWTEELKAGMKPGNMGMQYGIQFVFALVMAFVLAHSLIFAATYLQISGIAAGLEAGFWSWLGFVAPATVGAVLWERRPWSFWLLNNGYYLVTLCAMGVVLSLWQ